MRTTWKYYYEQVNGLVFVVDSIMDKSELWEVRDTIHQVLAETRDMKTPILILANKQDLPNAMADQKMWEELSLDSESMKRKLRI